MLPFAVSSIPAYHHLGRVNITHATVNERCMFSHMHTATKVTCWDFMLHFTAYLLLLSCEPALCVSFQMCKSPYLWPSHEPDSPLKAFFSAPHVRNLIIHSFTLHRRRLWAEPGRVDVQASNKNIARCLFYFYLLLFEPAMCTHIAPLAVLFS